MNVGAVDTVHVDESGTPLTAHEVYTKDAVDTTFATKTEVNAKADSTTVTEQGTKITQLETAVGNTYTKGEVDTKLAAKADSTTVTEHGTKITQLETAVGNTYTKAEADGKFATSEALNTAKTDLEGKITSAKNELDGKITANTQKIGANETAITDLKDADVRLEGKINQNTNDITGLKDKDVELSGKIDNNKNLIDQNAANITQNKNDIVAIGGRLTTAEGNIQTNTDAINALDTKVGTINNGNYLDGTKSVGENLNALDAQTKTNTDEIERVNQELVNTNNHFNTELGKTNTALNKEVQERVDADTKLTGRIDATDKRTAGIKRTDTGVEEDNQTVIEGKVHFDQNGNVSDVKGLSAETITTTGDAAIGGALGVTGATTLDGALTANGEATFKDKVSVEKDLTVNGKLNVGEISMKNVELDAATGNKHDSATSITADGISNIASIENGGTTTKSQFSHNEKGTFNSASKGDSTDWKEATSNVTADGVENIAKDSKGNNNTFTQTSTDTKNTLTDKEGNTSTTRQDSKGVYGYAKDKDGNKSYTKQEGNRIAESVIGQDGKETKSEMTSTDITNTAKDGTIKNDAKDIVNNATGDMTNNVGGNLSTTVGGNEIHEVKGTKTETVEGKVTENFKNGQETNVTGNQDIHVTGKQTNTVGGGQENIISGGQTNTITGGQINNITGDQTTIVTDGNISNTAKNITNTATDTLTDKVGGNTRVTTSTSITDTVGTTTNRKIEDGKITDTAGDSTVTTENGKGTTFAKTDSAAYSTEAGAPKDTNIAGNLITTGRVNANELSVSDKDGDNTADLSVKAGEDGGVKASAGNGTTTGSLDVKADKVTTSIKSGSKENTVTSTADGTIFSNSEANTVFEGGRYTDTTIKGNTITTGKVTMDYAEVMKDLGVGGNANIAGTTTTKTLKVTENATVGGTLDVTKKATFHDDVDIAKNLSVGGNATIAGDVTARSYKVDGKTYIDADGIHANNQKITDVADGSISEGSKDAVNGGQLYGVKRDLEHQVDKVGANAAAMANLRPMEFDPSSKWNIAAAIGNYGSETAAALGAFYRPNDNVMVNLSTAFGTGENMVGGGVSVRLGKGGNKLSREENNALKAQVDDLTARMDALLSVLNPNMSKDFPDVPENHWAYEAVSRLAGNDIVQGYPDGEFHGERTMTRYEMAEIIYNALSRGAEAERELVEEFKPELQAMAASEKATAERAEG